MSLDAISETDPQNQTSIYAKSKPIVIALFSPIQSTPSFHPSIYITRIEKSEKGTR